MTREQVRRAAYTLEYKLEAVRLVKGGQAKSVTAKILGIPPQTLDNWLRLSAQGKLTGRVPSRSVLSRWSWRDFKLNWRESRWSATS